MLTKYRVEEEFIVASRRKKLGKASIFAIVGGIVGGAVAQVCEFTAIGLLATGAASMGAAAAPVLITVGAVGGLGAYGLHTACKRR